MDKALLIIGHGSRSPEAIDVFNQTLTYVRQHAPFKVVAGAFMELASPSIEDAVKGLMEKGIVHIIAVPYFLYPGIHLKQDIPEIIAALSSRYAGLEITLAKPIGFEEVIGDLLIERANAV